MSKILWVWIWLVNHQAEARHLRSSYWAARDLCGFSFPWRSIWLVGVCSIWHFLVEMRPLEHFLSK